MARKIVTVDDSLRLPTAVRNQIAADVQSDLSSTISDVENAASAASLSAIQASNYASQAETAANQAVAAVTGDADSVVASLIADTDSDIYAALLSAGLGSGFVPTTLEAGTNYNSLITPGWYLATSTYTNAPAPGNIVLQVQRAGTFAVQTAFSSVNNASMYSRHTSNSGSSWSAWKNVSFSDHTHTPESLGVYSGSDTDALIDAIQDSFVDSEDLFVSWTKETGFTSGTTSLPIFIAPFPLRITSVALSSYQVGTTVPTSDTNWWLTRIRYTRTSVSTAAVNIATKTTRATAGAEPAGEAILPITPWRYDGSLFASANLEANDVVSMVFSAQGTPTAIVGPITITVGYEPL